MDTFEKYSEKFKKFRKFHAPWGANGIEARGGASARLHRFPGEGRGGAKYVAHCFLIISTKIILITTKKRCRL